LVVIDSSAWVEFLRRSEHPARSAVRKILQSRTEIATTEVVTMELLAGARSDEEAQEVRSSMLALQMLPLNGLADFEVAAALYRACRQAGETIRTMTDCLIAAVAIEADAPILHKDRDFDAIARHSDLRIHPL
jgi:predicted nucleic acid-binding protein